MTTASSVGLTSPVKSIIALLFICICFSLSQSARSGSKGVSRVNQRYSSFASYPFLLFYSVEFLPTSNFQKWTSVIRFGAPIQNLTGVNVFAEKGDLPNKLKLTSTRPVIANVSEIVNMTIRFFEKITSDKLPVRISINLNDGEISQTFSFGKTDPESSKAEELKPTTSWSSTKSDFWSISKSDDRFIYQVQQTYNLSQTFDNSIDYCLSFTSSKNFDKYSVSFLFPPLFYRELTAQSQAVLTHSIPLSIVSETAYVSLKGNIIQVSDNRVKADSLVDNCLFVKFNQLPPVASNPLDPKFPPLPLPENFLFIGYQGDKTFTQSVSLSLARSGRAKSGSLDSLPEQERLTVVDNTNQLSDGALFCAIFFSIVGAFVVVMVIVGVILVKKAKGSGGASCGTPCGTSKRNPISPVYT
eukprot:TRINITY_DN6737_c0_g1_i1.p1 TRINITY_DN6737_c0_g1~~TRINITY_DN6737_c0_g1_i1.p1  ORF type:complete len:414 (+),score=85.62 TRINITY_DN6737_c0_g1_i1:59-1300(+)